MNPWLRLPPVVALHQKQMKRHQMMVALLAGWLVWELEVMRLTAPTTMRMVVVFRSHASLKLWMMLPSTFRSLVSTNRFMHGLVATLPSLDIYMLLPLPHLTVSVTNLLGGTSDNTGSSVARRLVHKTGLNVLLACNIPKNSPTLEAAAEKKLVQKLINLGYVRPKSKGSSS
ncbi:uncharacterized protein LOC127808370 isoform X2 [Diospyros lotus]|uniref:uncharacterized protein LOC127808370 isoform X2 n=1 Tax=Diospyros lotus TaxID=55363 RepID=UPI0022524D6A|nr:uncharacterized protein LOC127808370 isoform X2 [Diospyros lotus]XP_052202882.1 uncharacterized protein LOC127808370 isoform X2 [Diospyros lotus]